jgi:hypothetical protein
MRVMTPALIVSRTLAHLMRPLLNVFTEVTGVPELSVYRRPGGIGCVSAGAVVTSHSLAGGPAAASVASSFSDLLRP